MRKIIVNAFMSLDGVIQGPGGPQEDTSGHFKFSGWQAPYDDEAVGTFINKIIQQPNDLLLGRKTYEIFAAYWPFTGSNPVADQFNKAVKYVGTNTLQSGTWANTVLLNKNAVEQVKTLKTGNGPDLQTWGSANFLQALLAEELIDEMNLLTYPLLLGKGKRLFNGHAAPRALTLTGHEVTGQGIIIAQYRRAGAVTTGAFMEIEPSELELERRKKNNV